MLQSFNQPHGPSVDFHQYVPIPLILGSTKLHPALQVRLRVLLIMKPPMHQHCIDGPRPIWGPPEPADPSLKGCFPVGQPPACTGAWGCSSPKQNFTFSFAELHEIPLCPLLQVCWCVSDRKKETEKTQNFDKNE